MNSRPILLCVLGAIVLAGCKTTAPIASTPAPTPPPVATTPVTDTPPDSEVFLADLDIAAHAIKNPRNITQRVGYDNQPAFLVDDSAVLFISDRTGSTDVYRFDIASNKTTQVTATEEGEFSPTPLADSSGFSAIRASAPEAVKSAEEYTQSQQLWRYGFDGKPLNLVLDARRVGYHAWLDENHVALWFVGDDEKKIPHTLSLSNLSTGKSTLLSSAPGRSLGRTPDGKRISFVEKNPSSPWAVMAAGPGDEHTVTLVNTPEGTKEEAETDRSEDYCWLPDGSLLMAKGNVFLRWDGRSGNSFSVFADMGEIGGDIKRLAVSHDGKHVAFVVQMRVNAASK